MNKSADFEQYLETANEALQALLAEMDSTELTTQMTPADVACLVAKTRLAQRRLAAVLILASEAAKLHAAAGVGPPVEEVLRDGLSVGEVTARQETERARVSERFPAVRQSIVSGEAFPENVDVLARITSRMTETEITELAEADHRLAKSAGRLSSDSFRKSLERRRNKIRADHGQTAAQQASANTFASIRASNDERTFRVAAVFDPLQGTAAQIALDHEFRRLSKELGEGHGMDSEQISAQALHDLIVRGASTTPTEENNRPGVVLHVHTDGQTMATGPHKHSMLETNDRVPLTPGVLGRLACDCVIRRIETLPDGNVHVSVSSRTATPTQRAALRALYDRCPISGAPWSQMEVHHVKFVSDGGETELSNLIPISRRWHHLIHDEGWKLAMAADRTLELSRPDGTLHKSIAPPIPVLHQHALAA